MSVMQWNVRVMREGQAQHIGQVAEDSEALARCAALSLYGVTEDEVDAGEVAAETHDIADGEVNLIVVRASSDELDQHARQLDDIDEHAGDGCLWKRLDSAATSA